MSNDNSYWFVISDGVVFPNTVAKTKTGGIVGRNVNKKTNIQINSKSGDDGGDNKTQKYINDYLELLKCLGGR